MIALSGVRSSKVWAIREQLHIKELGGFYRACAAGAESGCTFCIAIQAPPLQIGDEVIVLSDWPAGATGTVVPVPEASKQF